jgi:hypothetical protein
MASVGPLEAWWSKNARMLVHKSAPADERIRRSHPYRIAGTLIVIKVRTIEQYRAWVTGPRDLIRNICTRVVGPRL